MVELLWPDDDIVQTKERELINCIASEMKALAYDE
jgi:hypothetical protein